jgi:hypothetical protein
MHVNEVTAATNIAIGLRREKRETKYTDAQVELMGAQKRSILEGVKQADRRLDITFAQLELAKEESNRQKWMNLAKIGLEKRVQNRADLVAAHQIKIGELQSARADKVLELQGIQGAVDRTRVLSLIKKDEHMMDMLEQQQMLDMAKFDENSEQFKMTFEAQLQRDEAIEYERNFRRQEARMKLAFAAVAMIQQNKPIERKLVVADFQGNNMYPIENAESFEKSANKMSDGMFKLVNSVEPDMRNPGKFPLEEQDAGLFYNLVAVPAGRQDLYVVRGKGRSTWTGTNGLISQQKGDDVHKYMRIAQALEPSAARDTARKQLKEWRLIGGWDKNGNPTPVKGNVWSENSKHFIEGWETRTQIENAKPPVVKSPMGSPEEQQAAGQLEFNMQNVMKELLGNISYMGTGR